MGKLHANGRYILIEEVEPEVNGVKASLIMNPGDLNPSLRYGKVLSTGDECLSLYDGDLVYVNRMNAIKLYHHSKDYFIVHENDIFAYISEKEKEEEKKDA
jgi:hypothetical protein